MKNDFVLLDSPDAKVVSTETVYSVPNFFANRMTGEKFNSFQSERDRNLLG